MSTETDHPTDEPTPSTFEDKLRAIETLVHRLESGELPLEQSLAEFEHGMRLIEAARRELQQAEQRVRLITEAGEASPAPQPPEGAAGGP